MKSNTSSTENTHSIWDIPQQHLKSEQLKLIRSAIQPVNPWQSLVSCVDGRELENDGDYVQVLGGELQSVLWIQFCSWLQGREMSFREAFEKNNQLHQTSHLRIGIHTGPHARHTNGVTDCGYADNLFEIVQTLGENGGAIQALLNHGARCNDMADLINQENQPVWDEIVGIAKKITKKAQHDKEHRFMESGAMFRAEEHIAGTYAKTMLIGEHQERYAHINLIPNTSANTRQLNKHGLAGFNLDLWYGLDVVAQSKAFKQLGCQREFITLLTLGLYQATERVLRAERTPLPIIVTKD